MKACSSINRTERGTPARHRLYAGLLVALAALAMGVSAHAQQRDVELIPQNYSITAGSLGEALNQLATQSKLQVVYSPDLVRGKKAPAVDGRQTWREALQRLLADSGLEWGFVNDTTVVIRKGKAKPKLTATPAPVESAAPAGDKVTTMPEILVVGSRSQNTDIPRTKDDPQPYVVFSREEIERSGAQDIQDFLRKKLTSITDFATSGISTGNSGNASSIGLRGLGPDETLILVDGRRRAGRPGGITGTGQPDINGIPLASIERIEVLPTTASGIYGGEATGGVINIVLRRDYSGVEAAVNYGSTFDGHAATRRVDLAAGTNVESGRTNILVSASYSDAIPLFAGDRDLIQRGRATILANNPTFFTNASIPPAGTTTNIRSTTGANLTLDDGTPIGSPITSVPIGYGGVDSDAGAGLIANASRYNLDLSDDITEAGRRQALVNAPTTKAISLGIRRNFTDWLNIFADASYNENAGSFERISTGGGISYMLAGDAPGNPFQQDVTIRTPLLGAKRRIPVKDQHYRGTLGLTLDLPKDWTAGADFTWNRSVTSATIPSSNDIDTAAATAATALGLLDIFRDTNVFPVDFSPFVRPASINNLPQEVIESTLAFRTSGPLPFSLPGGRPTISFLAEWRDANIGKYTSTDAFSTTINGEQSRKVLSAYSEVHLPIISGWNDIIGVHLLELQIAGRADKYQTDAAGFVQFQNDTPAPPAIREITSQSSFNPTIALRYAPIPDITFRASYGTGFLPPSTLQLVPRAPSNRTASIWSIFGVTDPLRGNTPLGDTTLVTGGSSDVDPEETRSYSAGVIITPRIAPDLRISVDWTRIDKTDAIAVLFPTVQSDLNSLIEFFPERITRNTDPSTFGEFGVGPITGIDQSNLNLSKAKIEAIDLAIDYSILTRIGQFFLQASATYLDHNQTQVKSEAPLVENTGVTGNLKWRANGTINWEYGNWLVQWTTRYYDSYYLNVGHMTVLNQGAATIPSQVYHDVFARYRFDKAPQGLPNLEIVAGINNVFNRRPPVDVSTNTVGFFSPLGDPRRANYYVGLRASF